jgi:hypothetical protein
MLARTSALLLTTCLTLHAWPAAAQFPPRTVNPEAVDFESEVLSVPGLTTLRVELFMAGSDIGRDFPAKSFDLALSALQEGGRVRVVLKGVVLDVPNGQYVAAVRAIGPGGSAQTEPSQVFVLAQEGTPQDRAALEKQERKWTKIAWAIGAGIFIIPIVAR